MPKKLDVGRSNRTPAKHDLMSSIFGKEIGAVSRMPAIDRHVWIDLTAGDGVPNEGGEWGRNCSPGIAARHAANASKPVDLTLYEIQPNTFDRLLDNLAMNLPEHGYERITETIWAISGRVTLHARNRSGLNASVDHIGTRDAVVVSNDPNAITSWAMRPTFMAEIARQAWCLRSITTMGCNVGGIKRLSAEERAGWFDLLKPVQDANPPHRDLLLAAIEGDSSQWAYLLGEPVKWREKVDAVVRTAFGKHGYSMDTAWLGGEPDAFDELKGRLFLTQSERAAR